jgi:hypothetical protein
MRNAMEWLDKEAELVSGKNEIDRDLKADFAHQQG